MITYQDYLKAESREGILKIILDDFISSDFYKRALKAKAYYKGQNDILERLQWFYNSAGYKQVDDFKANNTIPSEFFKKIVKQENSYLLANGVTLEDNVKNNLGKKFDVKVQKAGLEGLLSGVSWTYCYKTDKGFEFDVWQGTEFIPLFDEETGTLMAGLRFFRIDTNKPYNLHLYEIDGISKYRIDKERVVLVADKVPYVLKKKRDMFSEQITGSINFSMLPIVPFYGNDVHESSLTVALKHKIDLYDIVASDFGNNLEDSQDVYWVLKNYSGQDMGEFLADYKYYKSVKVDDDGDATAHTVEVPYEARRTALEILRKDIYADAMALDATTLTGGSLTTVAIKAAMIDLDLKTDDFENEAMDYIDNLLNLYTEITGQASETEIKFIRRALINDTEVIDNIQKMRMDISHKTALELNPYIDNVDDELDRIAEEGANNWNLDNVGGTPQDIKPPEEIK